MSKEKVKSRWKECFEDLKFIDSRGSEVSKRIKDIIRKISLKVGNLLSQMVLIAAESIIKRRDIKGKWLWKFFFLCKRNPGLGSSA